MTAPQLSPADLGLAAVLLVGSAALSAALSLGVGRTILVAGARMAVQLVLVGLALRWVFSVRTAWVTGLVVLAMVVAAGRELGARGRFRFAGWWNPVLGALTVAVASLAVSLVALATALRPTPWFEARQVVPVVGIVLGTVMNAGSLALNAVLSAAARERATIEARLALGATRHEAFGHVAREAVLAGVLPIANQMAAAGLITLPGIMTGQVLAGLDPLQAARTQILLLSVLAGGGVLGSVVAVRLAVWRLTDARDRLRLDRVIGRG